LSPSPWAYMGIQAEGTFASSRNPRRADALWPATTV
jgi:hypothetical protein